VALVLLRELGPVVTGLLFAGRAGSAVTAEIGLMKATDQLSSMEMMGVDPLHRIIAPRLWAGNDLHAAADRDLQFGRNRRFCDRRCGLARCRCRRLLGRHAGRCAALGRQSAKGWSRAEFFGVVISWIAVFQGYDSTPTAEGISVATTKTVVYSSVAVLALDFILTLVMYGDFN
jgi:phospholipid/cholesterol/gamma-HCH transport system permease protein